MQTIAVVGASADRSKYGNKCVRAYAQKGWKVYPVNRSGKTIEELPGYAQLADVPGDLDRISIYLHPEITRSLLPEIAARGATEIWFNPGSANREVLAEAEALGVPVVDGCSIVDIGLSPSRFV